MATHTNLRGFNHVGESLLSDQLESNLHSFFSWGLLGKGAFWNVNIPTSGAYEGNDHQLKMVDDPNYTEGQVWEAFRQDWVWETGIEYDYQPIRVSGVFVNGDFQPVTGVGTYQHSIDYRYGRVTFDTEIQTTDIVTCEYSFRMYNVYPGSSPWWREIQTRTYRSDEFHGGSGVLNILATNRVQLPAIVVQTIPRSSRTPYEIGSLVNTVHQDVLFHVIGETPTDVCQIHDMLTYQQDHTMIAYDKNQVLASERFGLDAEGSPSESGLMYPDLVAPTGDGGYAWKKIRFLRMSSSEQSTMLTSPLYQATVRGTFTVEIP